METLLNLDGPDEFEKTLAKLIADEKASKDFASQNRFPPVSRGKAVPKRGSMAPPGPMSKTTRASTADGISRIAPGSSARPHSRPTTIGSFNRPSLSRGNLTSRGSMTSAGSMGVSVACNSARSSASSSAVTKLRKTDLRGYSSFEEVLSPDWDPSKPYCPQTPRAERSRRVKQRLLGMARANALACKLAPDDKQELDRFGLTWGAEFGLLDDEEDTEADNEKTLRSVLRWQDIADSNQDWLKPQFDLLATDPNRPPSPLRPGVYVGHNDASRLELSSAHGRHKLKNATPVIKEWIAPYNANRLNVNPGGFADGRPMGSSGGRFAKSALRVTKTRALVAVAKLDDEDDERKQQQQAYLDWRKKVMESTKKMKLQAERFR